MECSDLLGLSGDVTFLSCDPARISSFSTLRPVYWKTRRQVSQNVTLSNLWFSICLLFWVVWVPISKFFLATAMLKERHKLAPAFFLFGPQLSLFYPSLAVTLGATSPKFPLKRYCYISFSELWCSFSSAVYACINWKEKKENYSFYFLFFFFSLVLSYMGLQKIQWLNLWWRPVKACTQSEVFTTQIFLISKISTISEATVFNYFHLAEDMALLSTKLLKKMGIRTSMTTLPHTQTEIYKLKTFFSWQSVERRASQSL